MNAHSLVRKLVEEDQSYRTSVKVDVSGLETEWHSETRAQVTVGWMLDIDAREWGVKTLLPVVTSIEGNIELTAYVGEEDQHKSLPISWKSGDAAFSVESTNSQSGDSIFPREVEIDLERKHILVTF